MLDNNCTMRIIGYLFAIGLLLGSVGRVQAGAAEETYFIPKWTAKCSTSGKNFELQFVSRSGQADADDMAASLRTPLGNTHSLPIPPGLYVRRSSVSSETNLCNPDNSGAPSATAMQTVDGTVLFFLSKDGRPGLNTLVLALVDINTGALLDQKDTGLEIKDSSGREQFTIRKTEGGYQVRLVTEYLEDTGTDSIENFIEAWVTISVRANKLYLDHGK